MFELIFAIFITTLVIYGQGIAFNNYIIRNVNLNNNFFETFFFGFIFLGFNTLLINFLFPINKIVGTIIFILSTLVLIVELIKNRKIKLLVVKFAILIFITFFLIAFSNVNRPDAGLYHLPYTSIINENKIIIGLTNLHFRFGHISIMQYISSAFNNTLIPLQSISIPSALIFSSFMLFVFSSLKETLKKNDFQNSLIYFLTFVISVYSYNRFSEYGNDTPAHIFFLLFFIYILTKEKNNKLFSSIILISTFLFLLKPFMAILITLIFYLFIKQKNKIGILFDKKIIFSILFLTLWLIKNTLISGCLIYPISKLCSEKLIFSDIDKTKIEQVSGEAWSKDWSNYKDKKYSIQQYNKNFRWLDTWYNNHLKIIIEKFFPILVFLILIYFFLQINKKNNLKTNKVSDDHILIIFFFTFVLIWFIKFPLYRYGSSFLIALSIYILFIITKKFDYSNKSKNFNLMINYILIFSIILFFAKNSLRIFNDYKNKQYFPQIFSLIENNQLKPSKFKKVNLENKGNYYFSNGELCMYSRSPCTHIKLNDIVFKKSYRYKMFYKKKNK